MKRPVYAMLCALTAFALCRMVPAHAAAALTTQQRLNKLGEDLAQGWVDYAKDNQKTVRDQHFSDLNAQFTKDITLLDPPPNTTIEKATNFYFDSIKKTTTFLKFEKMHAERQLYSTACTTTFKREFLLATDYKANRSTQQLFEIMMEFLSTGRESLRTVPTDIRNNVYTNINSTFNELVRNATIPDKPEPAEQMDANLKEIRKRFPTPSTTPELVAANQPIASVLESMARQIEQQAAQRKK